MIVIQFVNWLRLYRYRRYVQTSSRKNVERKAIYLPDMVFPLEWTASNLYTQYLSTFLVKGLKCVSCDRTVAFFALERYRSIAKDTWHLVPYALEANGQETLMTVDHILPRSKGGGNIVENYQPMCTICNERKADEIPAEALDKYNDIVKFTLRDIVRIRHST